MTEERTPLDCYVMGEESLLVQCAHILQARGHRILGVITNSEDIARWASGESLPVHSPGGELADWVQPHDVFFSIANLRIVPDGVLAKSQRGAVNFHDGPLPRYAGLNAPNWALLHGERTHGVTWHRIEGGVDEGRILARRPVELAPLMTAFELNTACYEAAIASFPEVLERFESADERRALGDKQDLSERTYFAKHDRPPSLGLIPWRDVDAEGVVGMIRALDYGPSYPSPLLFAKVVDTGGRPLLVREAEVGASPEGNAGRPGEVIEADHRSVVVAARQGSVRLTRVTDIYGRAIDTHRLAGQELGTLDEEMLARLTRKNTATVPFESFWAKRLEGGTRLSPPGFLTDPIGDVGVDAASPERVPLHTKLDPQLWLAAMALGMARLGELEESASAHVGYRGARLAEHLGSDGLFFASAVPLRVSLDGTVNEAMARVTSDRERVDERLTYALDLIARRPLLKGRALDHFDVVLAPEARSRVAGSMVTIARDALHFDAQRVDRAAVLQLARRLEVVAAAVAMHADFPAATLPLLDPSEIDAVIREPNQTAQDYARDKTVHQLFEAQVDRTPDDDALIFEGERLTYAQLDARANRVAQVLRSEGVTADAVVGLCCQRSLDLVVGALGILKAGGAYLPLDPEYPEDRLTMMLQDSGAQLLVTHGETNSSLHSEARTVRVDGPEVAAASDHRVPSASGPEHMAYLIYTSGSTGRPKGVMVEHRNVSNFFTGMSKRIPHGGERNVWLAVTSLSFDISVLELFWTLTRGFTVVVYRERERSAGGLGASTHQAVNFGLFYWGNDDAKGSRKYELLLEGAKLADRSGFTSLWTPERHFHAFGGPYPNPAITGAAVAAVTRHIDVRAGSVVAPLHHPARIAEEWAVVDNLTGGRVGLAFASGWQPDDFVLRPENAPPNNKSAMLEAIDTVRRLWRGEAVAFPRADGSTHEVVTQPRPVSAELAVWVTTAGNPETYVDAARKRANVLTHLLGQSIDELKTKIALYRQTLEDEGVDPKEHKVTLMLHTYLDEDKDTARTIAREPMKDYLRSAAGLIKQYAWAFPAFKKPSGATNAFDIDLGSLGDEEMEAILEFAFLRYFEDSGLFGTVDDAAERVAQLAAIGVDEIACLIDYGIPTDKVLQSIRRVASVIERTKDRMRSTSTRNEDWSMGATIERLGVTHLQCTPSMARLLTVDERSREALAQLRQLLIGGEALPGALVGELRELTRAPIENMYGPTETCIWSSTAHAKPCDGVVPLGTPIANTQLYVLDAQRQPVPVGLSGELYIGGDGVTRGYLGRPELTEERFVSDPFGDAGARMYRTGDRVRRRADGELEFLGRMDHQVKLRGYRIELGEIESRLREIASVREAVVSAREDSPDDKRLVAYLVTDGDPPDEGALRRHLSQSLPDYMVPSHFVAMDALPLTPNKKVDRSQLPPPGRAAAKAAEYVSPSSPMERRIAEVWGRILGVDPIGAKGNFFELGGHSLLAVQAHRELKAALQMDLKVTDIFQYPTLGALAAHLDDRGSAAKVLDKTAARAAARREAMRRRRGR